MDKLLPYNIAHYILGEYISYLHQFKGITKRAKIRFESRDWHGIQADARERLTLYRKMVGDATDKVLDMIGERDEQQIWKGVKTMYAEDVLNLNTREIAETFYNSVYRHAHKGLSIDKEMMFVLPSLEKSPFRSVRPIYRTYPGNQTAKQIITQILADYNFDASYVDLERDVSLIEKAIEEDFLTKYKPDRNTRVEVLRSVFYRNKCAYLIGRAHLQDRILPFVLPILHNENGLYIDALLTETADVSVIFSYYRSYFLVDIDMPHEYVEFLKTIIPKKGIGELYNSIGFEKHGKTEVFRSYLRHLQNSDDKFVHAPGIKGMVMSVFTLPSYNMVFKLIKDQFDVPKRATREQVKEKYALVSRHDRVGRLADTYEFENFVFPKERFSQDLLDDLKVLVPSLLVINEDTIEIKHLYAEKKMIPLNLYLENCSMEDAEVVVEEYGNAIKQLAAANIFPGDMLLKNFGVTRLQRVVFYDYDEISLITDCNFRIIPEADDYYDELSSEPWYSVGENDIFPEEFRRFLIGNRMVRNLFFKYHDDIFDVKFWKEMQGIQERGEIIDVFPYRNVKRFVHRYQSK